MRPRLTLLAAALVVSGCIDWDSLSTNYEPTGSSQTGGGAAGGGGGGAPAEPFCASLSPKPLVCNDFDGVGPLVDWSSVTDPPGGSQAIDEMIFLSGHASLRAEIPADGDTFFSTTIVKPLSVQASTVKLGLDLRIEHASADPMVVAAATFAFGPACGVGIEVIENGARAVQWTDTVDTPFAFAALPGSPAAPGWARIELVYVAEGTPTVSLYVDGVPAYENEPAPGCAPSEPEISVGINYTPPGDGWIVNIDNLVVDAF
ncbi:MAG: hypothetical protein HOV80_34115 [Polyangiaceae bacterium]|nr:hypothetical protein [Polyangiaceae bacterium]